MGRLFVLLAYGGLYSDLDVLPNRTSYEQCWMAVLLVERHKQSWITTANDVAHSRTAQNAAHCKSTAIKRPSLSSREFVSSGDKGSTYVRTYARTYVRTYDPLLRTYAH